MQVRQARGVAFSPDDQLVAAATTLGFAQLFEFESFARNPAQRLVMACDIPELDRCFASAGALGQFRGNAYLRKTPGHLTRRYATHPPIQSLT